MDEPVKDSRTFGVVLIFSLTAALIMFVGVVKFMFLGQEELESLNSAYIIAVANKLTDNPKPDQMESAWSVKEIKLEDDTCSFKVEVNNTWFAIHVTKAHPKFKDYVDNLRHYPDYLTFAKTANPTTHSLGDLIYPTSWSISNKEGFALACNQTAHFLPTL